MPIHIQAPQRFLRFYSLILGDLWGVIKPCEETSQGRSPWLEVHSPSLSTLWTRL